ncbi:RepA [Bifidobacterium sp. DSM 109957]|uniref:RepA n=2 Tax=Bifidobacterium oedipodis TaxID=2675322 RepID=A0A7Y0ENC3_9BIFI|nr:RepA [Bifidobacterium sp. DSM 109957]
MVRMIVHQDLTAAGVSLGNLVACKSRSCPRCAGVIAHERSEELARGLRWWLEYPGREESRPMRCALFITFTVQHSMQDDAQSLMDAVSHGRTALTAGAAYRGNSHFIGDRKRFGIAGWVHTIENTWNPVNGHHVHLHSIVLLDRAPTVDEYQQLVIRLFTRWERSLEKDGYTCDFNKGYSVEFVSDSHTAATKLAEYVTKDTAERAAFELLNGQGKHGRHGSMTMFQILARLALDDGTQRFWFPLTKQTRPLWLDDSTLAIVNAESGEVVREYPVAGNLKLLRVVHEIEQALKGRRLMTFSKRSTKPACELDTLWNEFLDRTRMEELTDEQIADRRDTHSYYSQLISADDWYHTYVRNPEKIFELVRLYNHDPEFTADDLFK